MAQCRKCIQTTFPLEILSLWHWPGEHYHSFVDFFSPVFCNAAGFIEISFFFPFTHELYECTKCLLGTVPVHTQRQFKKCPHVPVFYSPASCVFEDQAVCSNATATLIHDSPPTVREYFTPFPISARAESCCYRNIHLNNLNTLAFVIPIWLKMYTKFLRMFFFFW